MAARGSSSGFSRGARIADGLAGVNHVVAVGSGKGGIGKSTLDATSRRRPARARPSHCHSRCRLQRPVAGPHGRRPGGRCSCPASQEVALPRTADGIAIFSLGSLIHCGVASARIRGAAHGESHTGARRGSSRFSGEILRSFEWGALDLLIPICRQALSGPSSTPTISCPRTSFVLVTIPSAVSRGVVARSVAALSKAQSRLLGYVENLSGYYCRDCNAVKPLFAHPPDACRRSLGIPVLGTVPFDPELARHCDRGIPFAGLSATPVGQALDRVAQQLRGQPRIDYCEHRR